MVYGGHEKADGLRAIRHPRSAVTSRRLTALADRLAPGSKVQLGELLDSLGSAGLGLTLIILALPPLIPIPGPIGMIFGAAICLVAIQMMAGARRVWLPEFLRRRELPANAVKAMIARSVPWFIRAERRLHYGRMKKLTGRTARIVLGIPVLLLAIGLMMPFPFGNVPPVVALAFLALAMLERDGLAVIGALFSGVLALAWIAGLGMFGAYSITAIAAALSF